MVEEIEYSTPVLPQGLAASSVLAGNLSKTNLESVPAASTILFFFSFLSFLQHCTLRVLLIKKTTGCVTVGLDWVTRLSKAHKNSSTRLSGCLKPKDFGTLYNI